MSLLLGCIADDLTGATDLALTLVRGGLRTLQVTGLPSADAQFPDVDAIVIALKSRTIPPQEAVDQSLEACRWLKEAGARQIFFKYCSTFDSTDDGNIGPVADALLAELNSPLAIACPAFPANGRTVYQGHLFVADQLLSDSPLKDHPLTPMRDPDLRRVLARQSRSTVRHLPLEQVAGGPERIAAGLKDLENQAPTLVIVDAVTEQHLMDIGAALASATLITGGSGVAMGLPALYRALGWLDQSSSAGSFAVPSGKTAILAGSCSQATRQQVQQAESRYPTRNLDVADLLAGKPVVADTLAWARQAYSSADCVMIYSSQHPEEVADLQARAGRLEVGEQVEQALSDIALGLRAVGTRRFVVAGGETSGAVVQALGVGALEIGPEINPGVPWTRSLSDAPLALALKSGNFGGADFFHEAVSGLATLQMREA
ncbi:3-oxo-tetronate kinase [Rhodovibrionaceae bacterium A322]